MEQFVMGQLFYCPFFFMYKNFSVSIRELKNRTLTIINSNDNIWTKGEIKMKNVRAKMLAKDLKGVVDLPDYPDNQLVEITVLPAFTVLTSDEEKPLTREERSKILKEIKDIMSEAKKNPDFNPNKTREEYRMERLAEKYAAFN